MCAAGMLPKRCCINAGSDENVTLQEAHPYEDFSCHVRVDPEKSDSTFLYGIFDGQDGLQAASFALQRMAAEILLYSQLSASSTDEEIREILRRVSMRAGRTRMQNLI